MLQRVAGIDAGVQQESLGDTKNVWGWLRATREAAPGNSGGVWSGQVVVGLLDRGAEKEIAVSTEEPVERRGR